MFTMSTSSAKYHHGDLSSALLSEGMALIEEKGLASLSLRHLARRLGVSAMAPYRHYPDKEALLASIAADGFRQLKARLREAEQFPTSRGSPLLQEGIAYVQFALDRPALFRLMFGVSRAAGQEPGLDTARAEAFDVLLRQVEPTTSNAERRTKARGWWALVHGLAFLLLDGLLQIPSGVAPDAWIAEIIGRTVFDE